MRATSQSERYFVKLMMTNDDQLGDDISGHQGSSQNILLSTLERNDLISLFDCRWSNSVKSWIHFLRGEEHVEEAGDTNNAVRTETTDSVKQRLRQIQIKTRSVLNICDKIQR